MMYCPKCGNQVSTATGFCPNCGNPINVQQNNQYNQQNNQYNQNNQQNFASRPVLENRSIGLAIVLSIVTCGIYGIIWFISMVNDTNRLCNDEKSSQSGGIVFLLTLITCGIYGIIWFYNAGKRLYNVGNKYGVQIADNSVLYLVLTLVGLSIVNYCLLQSDLNKFSA